MNAIVLAGGRGIRLQPYTNVLPKPLLPLDDMSILHIVLIQLRNAGFTRATLATGYKGDMIEQFFGNGRRLDIELRYSREPRSLGTAGPLSLVSDFDRSTLVMNVDLLTTLDFADLMSYHHRSEASLATVVLYRYALNIEFGVAELNVHQRLVNILEKPRANYLVNSGVYVLDPEILAYIPVGKYMDMPTVLKKAIDDNKHIRTYQFDGKWLDIGTPDKFDQAVTEFKAHRNDYLATKESRSVGSNESDANQLSSLPSIRQSNIRMVESSVTKPGV